MTSHNLEKIYQKIRNTTMIHMMLFKIMWALAMVLPLKGEGGCRNFQYLKCIENKTLTGHVISTIRMTTPALQLCQNKCFQEHKCVSYNLGPVLGWTRNCELNAADHSIRPNFMVNRTGYEYCPIQNACLSSPCPPGRLCTPDFAWDTHSCDDGGWTQWSPWQFPLCSLPSICVPTRTRTCTSPAPRNQGASCTGLAKEHITCKPLPVIDISGCQDPLGMEDGRIKDEQISASRYAGNRLAHAPRNGRLRKTYDNVGAGGWAAGGKDEHIQIDLGTEKVITMVASQGRQDCCPQWVTKYSLSYSNDGSNWKDYEGDCLKVFPANNDKNTIVTNKLEVPIQTRYIRLIVKDFSGHPTIRMEFYGCTKLSM